MCEANAYLKNGEEEVLVMEAVDTVEADGEDTWRLVGIFGDQKTVSGRIRSMNLVDHKILFEAVPQ
jgi:predicted RNA-binding protein